MLGNYSNFEGLQAFSKAFRSSSYNSSGASMYSVLDSSKKYANIGKRVLGFSRADSVALKERKDAETYGVGLTDFYKKTAEDQIKAPDAVKQPKYTGDSGEPREGGEKEGSDKDSDKGSNKGSEEGAEGGSESLPKRVESTVEPISAAEYQDLSEEDARKMVNRARMIKGISDFDGMNIKLSPSKTKSSVDIYVPTKEIRKAMIIHYQIIEKELPEGNLKRLVKYLAGGAPFKVKEGAPAPNIDLRKKEPIAKKSKKAVTPAAAVGGAGAPAAEASPAATRTPATAAITGALEGEKKKKPIKLKK